MAMKLLPRCLASVEKETVSPVLVIIRKGFENKRENNCVII